MLDVYVPRFYFHVTYPECNWTVYEMTHEFQAWLADTVVESVFI